MFKFIYELEKQTLFCKFSDRMDSENSPLAAQKINEKLDELSREYKDELKKFTENDIEKYEKLKIVFDLENVEFVSSSFIRICIINAKRVKPGNFYIVNTQPLIKKTFKIAGLGNLMDIS